MSEYIGAELAGRKEGDCFKFEKDCTRFDIKLRSCHVITILNSLLVLVMILIIVPVIVMIRVMVIIIVVFKT